MLVLLAIACAPAPNAHDSAEDTDAPVEMYSGPVQIESVGLDCGEPGHGRIAIDTLGQPLFATAMLADAEGVTPAPDMTLVPLPGNTACMASDAGYCADPVHFAWVVVAGLTGVDDCVIGGASADLVATVQPVVESQIGHTCRALPSDSAPSCL